MISLRRRFFTGASALTLAATILLAPGCKPKPRPEPFTAQLLEFEGVQAVYTLRHPKLLFGDLDKLMTEVPEAAMARMFFGQLTPFGYPEFSELETGANIGVAMLALDPATIGSSRPELVGFAKLKENGKIWNALAGAGLILEKHGTWTWIAQNASSFAKVKNPDALLAYIERPQTEDLRAWGRVSPALLAKAKEMLVPKLQAKTSGLPADQQKALLAYFDIAWGYLAQLHSGGGSLAFTDHAIAFTYSAQFLPDSPVGTWLRYAPGPAPEIARSVPADGLMNVVVRQNMAGQTEFVGGLLDALIAVDYPPAADALKAAKASYLSLAAQSDGGAVLTMSMALPKAGETPEIDLLGVQSGKFTAQQATDYYKSSLALSQKFSDAMISAFSSFVPGMPAPKINQHLTENALTIEGVSFGAVVTESQTTIAGQMHPATTTQYYGVVGGNLIYAMNEASLRAKVPALLAQKTVPDAVQAAFKDDEAAIITVPGAKIVDIVAGSLTLDLADPDVQAQLKTLKGDYAAAGPIKITVTTGQAQIGVVTAIPYKFIAQSILLMQFASAHKTAPATP